MTQFATGKNAAAICDRCGLECKYTELKRDIFAGRPTGLLVCADCKDVDHPQLMLGRFPVDDPQALRNPRLDVGREQSVSFFGWEPVGNPLTDGVLTGLGTVTVDAT